MCADVSEAANANAFQHWGGRVPIMVGATGHRNVDAKDAKLIAALRAQCALLRERYEHSPFVILSALAEGADRLVAQIAMEELSADLIAVLPMPQQEYERDFAGAGSMAEFRAFLGRAVYVKIAAVPEGDTSWIADGEPRNKQYACAGAIIADHAQILFSIWDGKPARGTGGTADQVGWFERGDSPNTYSLYRDAMSPLDPLEPGLSIRIEPATAEVKITKCPASDGDPKRRSRIRSILQRINTYNHDVLLYKARISASSPLVTEATGNVNDLSITDEVFRASDSLSAHFANKVRSSDSVIYLLALSAIAVFNFVSNKPEAPWIYLGITVVMAMLASRVVFRSIDNRFLEYRSLAEAMRTLFFWRNAGIMRTLWITYLSRQLGVMHWVRHAVRSVEFCQDCRLSAQDSFRANGIHVAKTCWVENQRDWFADKEAYHAGRAKFWKYVARVAIGASFATAVALALMTVLPPGSEKSLWGKWVKPDPYGDLWQAALGLFAAGGVAARGFSSRRAHLELTKQYAAQRQIFETASRMLEAVDHATKPEWTGAEVLEKLGEEALQEQSEWLWLRHTRPFEMPT